jgi:hypothetical protein
MGARRTGRAAAGPCRRGARTAPGVRRARVRIARQHAGRATTASPRNGTPATPSQRPRPGPDPRHGGGGDAGPSAAHPGGPRRPHPSGRVPAGTGSSFRSQGRGGLARTPDPGLGAVPPSPQPPARRRRPSTPLSLVWRRRRGLGAITACTPAEEHVGPEATLGVEAKACRPGAIPTFPRDAARRPEPAFPRAQARLPRGRARDPDARANWPGWGAPTARRVAAEREGYALAAAEGRGQSRGEWSRAG